MNERNQEEKNSCPRIAVVGRVGSGKSSLINALLEAQHCEVADLGEVHKTQQPQSIAKASSGLHPVVDMMNLPGFSAANKESEVSPVSATQLALDELSKADLGILVIAHPIQTISVEIDFLIQLHKQLSQDYARRKKHQTAPFPILIALNQIDKVHPIDDWTPTTLNFNQPCSEKEQNILAWKEHIVDQLTALDTLELMTNDVHLTCTGETILGQTNTEDQFGLVAFNEAIETFLPASKSFVWTTYSKAYADIQDKAQKIIWSAAVASATVAMVPIPLTDAVLITPIQVGMLLSLATLYGFELSWQKAVGFITPVIGVLGGRLLATSILKFIPGAGSVVSAGVAGVLTLAFGQAYNYFFLRGEFHPESAQVQEKVKELYETLKQKRDEILDQVSQDK